MRLLVSFLVWLVLCGGAMAQSLENLIAKLPEGSYSDRAAVVAQIGASGDERGAAVLKALSDGELQARKDDGAVIRVTGKGTKAEAFDVLTGATLGPVAARMQPDQNPAVAQCLNLTQSQRCVSQAHFDEHRGTQLRHAHRSLHSCRTPRVWFFSVLIRVA